MINAQYIQLDMVPSGVMPILYCSQYDVGRPLGVVVYNRGEAVDLDVYTVTVEATRTDGTPVVAAVATSDSIGVFTTTPTMTNIADKYGAQIVIVDGDMNRVASLPFIIRVTEATMDENSEIIYEDASLFEQYTQTIQGTIAGIRADLNTERATRAMEIAAAANAEAQARQTADNALQTDIRIEAAARASGDANLQSQISEIIMPSGTTPQEAEIVNARVGADGVTYATLGEAVRANDAETKNALKGLLIPSIPSLAWEQGGIRSENGNFYSSETRIRTTNYINSLSRTFSVTVPSGQKAYVMQYSSPLSTSIVGSKGWLPEGANVLFPAGYYYKIVLAYTGDTAIVPSAGSNFAAQYALTDTTFSIAGKAADASLTFGGMRIITADENNPKDLNNYINMGAYLYFQTSVPYIANAPYSGRTILLVFRSSNDEIPLVQIAVGTASVPIFIRARVNATTWTNWREVPHTDRALTDYLVQMTGEDDLDNATIGITFYSSSDVPSHAPSNVGGQVITFVNTQANGYDTQLYVSTVGTCIRYKSTAGWGEWTKLASADLGRFFGDASFDIKGLQTWEQGAIRSSNGTNYPDTALNYTTRIRSKYMYPVPASGLEIGIDTEGFKVFVFVYNEDNTYINSSGWLMPGQNFVTTYGQQLRFTVAYEDDSAILPDVNFTLTLKSGTAGSFNPIPTITMSGDLDQLESKEDKVTVTCSIMGATRTGTIKWQGSSSIRYPKKNFTLNKLAIPDVEGDKTGVDAWDMFRTFIRNYWKKMGNISYTDNSKLPHASTWGVRRKFVLKANWIDPSQARNIVGARLWSQVVQTRQSIIGNLASSPNYGAVDGFPVQLIVNGSTQGLYTVNISKDENLFAMGSGEHEYFIGAESNSLNACKWKATAVCDTTDYEIEYPEGDDETEQEAIRTEVAASLNQAIQTTIDSHEDWETNLAPYLDLESVTDYFIFMCCISGTDNIIKNILYGTYDGTKWFLSAYDMDSSFGFDPYGTYLWDVTTSRTQFAQAADNHRLAHLLYKYSPQRLISRYRELRAGVLSEANVWHEFARFINIIPENAYRKDREIWIDVPGTSMAAIYTFMEYYRMHCAVLDAEIDALEASLT